MSPTGISWAEETWNPVVGCEFVSDGCTGCYAAREAFGRLSGHPLYEGLAERRQPDELPRFTGELRWPGKQELSPDVSLLLGDRMLQPLRWRQPRLVFVNSMSDLFHVSLPDEFIARVFAVMSLAQQHTFQVLTKRPERLAPLLDSHAFRALVDEHRGAEAGDFSWPLPNVWIGTSIESDRYARIRIPKLQRAPAALRFLSVEPMLGPVDLAPYLGMRGIGWVIVGGESGPKARPMHPQWARTIRDQCAAESVPFHFKQTGEWAPPDWQYDPSASKIVELDGSWRWQLGRKPEGTEERLRPLSKVGKQERKRVSRLLDGVEHQAIPERQEAPC